MNELVRIRAAPVGFAADAFTPSDFLLMLELGALEDMRAELVGGVLEKMSPARGNHSTQIALVVVKLARALGEDACIAVDLAVVIGDKTVRGIDIAIARSRFPMGPASGSNVLMAVEISETTLARDLGPKAFEYARAGIPTYWVVDLDGRVVHVMTEPGDEGYALREVIRFGEPLAVPDSTETITID